MANDYSKLSKEELLKVVGKLESRKKYGLIWDEERTKEQFEKESKNTLPVLKEVKGKEIKTDTSKPVNILIEGDNYHTLSVLNYTHQGKIDIIYIDPPYNTGNKSWRYNNDYVERDDTFDTVFQSWPVTCDISLLFIPFSLSVFIVVYIATPNILFTPLIPLLYSIKGYGY
ncbi:MAG: hypothetical protein ABH952_04875 [Candidatus Omnitrophota bacterium]